MPKEQTEKKKKKKTRDYCFTLNGNIPPEWKPEILQYMCYQEELAPTTQQHHYQGFLCLKIHQSLTYVKNNWNKEAHLEVTKGTRRQAINYCKKKDGSEIPNTFKEFGLLLSQGKDSDLSEVEDKLKNGKNLESIVTENTQTFIKFHSGISKLKMFLDKKKSKKFRNINCYCYYGKTGTGKTRNAIENTITRGKEYYILDPPVNNTWWYDTYDGEDTLIIDEFYGQISQKNLLRICDGYALKCQIKGGFTWANWTTVIFTSNKSPDEWYKNGLTPAFLRRCPRENWKEFKEIVPTDEEITSSTIVNEDDDLVISEK